MIGFAAKRLFGVAVTLLVAAAIIFFLLDILPGDPARFMLGINATDDAVAALRTELGLDQSATKRFFNWLFGLFRGDLGISFSQRMPVTQLMAERLQVSLPLALGALTLSTLIGLPIGIIAAQNRGKLGDTLAMILAQVALPFQTSGSPCCWYSLSPSLGEYSHPAALYRGAKTRCWPRAPWCCPPLLWRCRRPPFWPG